MKNMNKKFVLSCLICIVMISFVFLFCNLFQNKNVKLDEVKLVGSDSDSSIFAIMIEQSDGTYKESDSKVWPTIGYDYDEEKSGCVDELGNTINGILTYDVVNRLARVKTNKAATCFLYFELLKKDLNVNISSENGSASLIGKYIDVEKEIDINYLYNLLNKEGFLARISNYDEDITLDMLINSKITNIKKV